MLYTVCIVACCLADQQVLYHHSTHVLYHLV